MDERFFFVYITCSSRDEALRIATDVVERRLAACANIPSAITSVYRWEDKIRRDEEYALILKTTAERFPNLKERVIELHSYTCPCVIAFSVDSGHSDFLQWIAAETACKTDINE